MVQGGSDTIAEQGAARGCNAEAQPPHELIGAFQTDFQQQISELMVWPALADLANTFPGLLFALATGYSTRPQRDETIRALLEGAPLKHAAQTIGLPMWLRRLPAEAFSGPLDGVPAWAELDVHVANIVPGDPPSARTWLSAVLIAAQSCDEPFALWTAGWAGRHARALATPQGETTLRWLAAWAWHSGQRGTAGYRLLRRPWSPASGHRRALDEMSLWRQRVTLAILLEAGKAVARPAGGKSLGLEFVALETAEDYIVEADIMDNCLDQFADRLLQGYSRVYAVRQNGRSVASLEIGLHDEDASMPAIRQLRGPRNRRASPAVWQAAYAWLGAQTLQPITPDKWRPSPSRVRNAACVMWGPYLAWLEARGSSERFRALVLGHGNKPSESRRSRIATAPIRPAVPNSN